jgi:predicted DNA-binding WGR domain protein
MDVAHQLWRQDRPFRVRLEYRGYNEKNKNGYSEKWWELTYAGSRGGDVHCNWGKMGTCGRSNPVSYDIIKAYKKAGEKENKGYTHAAGTATNMSQLAEPDKLQEMPFPYNTIRQIQRSATDQYDALDENGSFVMVLLPTVAQDLLNMSPLLRARSNV